MKQFVLILLVFFCALTANSQTSYNWNGSVSTDWNTAGNWTPNGIPGAADNIKIVTATNLCLLHTGASIANITLTSGTLDLGGTTLTVGGTLAQFSTGTIQNGTLVIASASSTVFGNGPITMNCIVNISSASITMKNTSFQNTVTITKTGSSNDASSGGNIFNGAVTLNNAGAGYLSMANGSPDQFKASAIFNNTGGSSMYAAYNSSNNVFGGVTTFNNASTGGGWIYVSPNSAGTVFSDSIILSCTGGAGIQFGGNAASGSTLAATKTINIGPAGFSTGALLLRQFTQTGATAQNISLTGSANLTLGPSTTFGGNVTTSSPALFLNGTTFNGTSNLTKTGSSGDFNNGGNVFNGISTITNSGSSYLVLGNSNPDIWNSDVTFTDNGSERILPGWNSVGNQFNGNIYVNSSGSAVGVQFCGGSSTATATLAAGKTIQAGAGGITTGYLYFKQFTQTGATAQDITLTGTGNLTFGPGTTFGGNVTASSPTLFLNGTTFNGTSNLTKTGSSGDFSSGGNVFNGVSTITNSGGSFLVLGNVNPDIWNNDVTFTDNGSERLLPGWNSVGNQFNGNIYINSSGSASGVAFCGGTTTATAILAAGKTIQAGAGGITAGYLYLKQFTQAGNAAINIMATGSATLYIGPASSFGGAFTATAPDITPQGAIYNGPVTFTKTGGTNNHNQQQLNIFNATCTINQQSSTGYFMLGYNSNEQFNDNIIVSSTGSGGIYLGWTSGTGTPTLASGKTIQVGTAGFSAGFLYLNAFTQQGTAPINLTFTGASTYLAIGRSSVIGGNLNSSSPDLYFNGATFNGTVNATRTGAGNDVSSGANTFQASTTIVNSGTGYLLLGNAAADTWNSDVTFTSTGSSLIGPAWNSAGTVFNGNITVNSTGSSQGIQFCGGATSSATLASGYTIQTGPAGFSSGSLYLRRFTQWGNAAINLTFTGSTTLLETGPSVSIGGAFTAVSPRIQLNGVVFSDIVNITKTGATGEWSVGGNVFNSTTTINQQGAGYFGFANGAVDIYNGDLYVNNNSTERVIFGNTPVGNQFNGNIILTQTGSSVGIAFGWNATTDETLAAGKTISVGTAGFSTGYLQIERFTQAGSAPISLPLTGTSSLIFGPTSTIGGNLISTSGSLYFNGCTFNGTVNSTKTGATSDASSGNNVFNGAANLTNAGSGYLMLGNGNSDQFMTNASFNNTGSGTFYVAYSSSGNAFGGPVTFKNTPTASTGIYVSSYSAGTMFNDNIVISSTSGNGVQFCTGNTSASVTLVSGKTIAVGAGGFSAGTLWLRQFTQTGATAQTLSLTGSGSLIYGPSSSFAGDVSSTSPTLFFNGATFNGIANCVKTGSSNDQSQGNNIFNGTSTFTNNGSGYLLMTATTADAYNGNVSFVQTTSGVIYPNYNNNSTYAGNVSVSSPAGTAITFGSGSGTASLLGSGLQTIGATGSTPAPVFTRLVVNNGNGVTLNTPVNVSSSLTLTAGLVNTTTTNLLTMLNGSSTAAGTSASTSFINGPMAYKKASSGVSTLNFPIGNGSDCRPVILTVNHSSGNSYTYLATLYDASAAALGYTLPPSVDVVSGVHYYTIGRTNAAGVTQPTLELSGNQMIQVFFGANDIVSNGSALTIVKNTYLTPTKWIDIGGTAGAITGSGSSLSGSLISTSSPTAFNSFSTFAIGDKIGGTNVLPVGLLDFTARAATDRVLLSWTTTTESNNSHFTIEKSKDGLSFEDGQTVASEALNGNSPSPLDYSAQDLHPFAGTSYYRLRQTDLDGTSTYSGIVSVDFARAATVSLYPNPSTGVLHLSGAASSVTSVKAEWFDMGGRTLLQAVVPVQGGFATLNAPFNNGVYLLRMTGSDGSVSVQNIIIMK